MALIPFFKERGPTKGGGPQDPPKKLQFVAQAIQNGQNWHNAPFGHQIFQNDSPKFWVKFFMWPWYRFSGNVAQPRGRAHKTPPRSYNLWPRQPKKAKIGIMHLLGPKFSKMTAPNVGPDSLCGPSTVFQGRWPNHGGGPQDHPKKRQFVAQATFWS